MDARGKEGVLAGIGEAGKGDRERGKGKRKKEGRREGGLVRVCSRGDKLSAEGRKEDRERDRDALQSLPVRSRLPPHSLLRLVRRAPLRLTRNAHLPLPQLVLPALTACRPSLTSCVTSLSPAVRLRRNRAVLTSDCRVGGGRDVTDAHDVAGVVCTATWVGERRLGVSFGEGSQG